MPAYEIVFKRQVEKDLRKIDRRYRKPILDEIEGLKKNPRPTNSRKMLNTEMTHRIRVGDYRVIYQVDDKNKAIIVFYIRHRKDAYKK
jgi:mRNA interferase RelE/StbE